MCRVTNNRYVANTIYNEKREMQKTRNCFENTKDCAEWIDDSLLVTSSLFLQRTFPDTTAITYVVATYPDNHCSLLSLKLQKTIAQLSPSDFFKFIYNELSFYERETLMLDESYRRKSFLTNWRRVGKHCGENMAGAGFYNLEKDNAVRCAFLPRGITKLEG